MAKGVRFMSKRCRNCAYAEMKPKSWGFDHGVEWRCTKHRKIIKCADNNYCDGKHYLADVGVDENKEALGLA